LAHQVFLSYATEDVDTARLLCRVLEQEEGIRCWIAPRDVEAGTDYAAAILEGIKDAELAVLLFSAHANASPYVLREIERAVAYERPVLSLRLDGTPPSASLEYYLNLWQWLDAPRGIESRRPEIVAAVRKQLQAARDRAVTAAPEQGGPGPAPLPSAPAPERATPPEARSAEGERKLVTVLVAGIAVAERDPEALRDLLTAYFERLLPAIERYGGTVDRFSGEEIVALFGAPKAHENDPERALRAALDMREALGSFNRARPVSVAVQFGVNTGLVYAGGVEAGDRRDYSVMGEAMKVAARLRAQAKPGEILVGPDTYRQAETLFEWQQVKGPAELQGTYRLIRARTGPAAPSGRPTRGLSSPLVGREGELAALGRALDRLRGRQGGVVLVTGEAGLGKSRLFAEARALAGQAKIPWLEGHTLSFGRTISYWPLLEIIQKDAKIESDDPEAERWTKLASRVGGLFGSERSEILPYLATLLSISLPEDLAQKVRYLDGEAMGRQVYRATRLYFARLARERPTVVVFEDVHWLDGSSAALLQHLLPLTREVPLLFLFAARPETDSPLTGLRELLLAEYADRLTEIALKPLSSEESTTLVRNLAHLDDLPARLRDTILGKAEGNPFFVEEVVRSLVDLGGLVQDQPGRYRVTEKAAQLSIPDTLQGVIMARIDRLDEDLKQVLRLASVVGRSFFYRVLAAIAQAEEELDKDLADLEEREFIREKARIPELEYIFKHALVQEATYESILISRRKELHRRVAEVIETLFAERLEEFYSLLAYHYSKAEEWEKAQAYLFKAGDQAGTIAADAEALAYYEEALEAYTRVFGDKWDLVERAILERKMGEALYRRGEHERAYEYLYRALAILGSPYPTSPEARRRATVGQLVVQLGHRLFWWLPRRPPSPEALRLAWERRWIYSYLGTMDVNTSRALFDMLVGLNSAESAGIQSMTYAWYATVGLVCDLVPLPWASGYYHRLCARWLQRERDRGSREEPEFEALAYLLLGLHEYAATGQWTQAIDHLRSARHASFAIGSIRFWAGATDCLSHLLIGQGELGEALELCQEAITFGQESGDRVAEAWGQMDAGHVLLAQGALAEAEACLRLAAAQLLLSLDPVNAAKTNAGIADCYLKQGRLEEARAILGEEEARLRESGARGYFTRHVRIANAVACLLAVEQAGDANEGPAHKEAHSACRDLLKHGRSDTPALVSAYRVQGTYEYLRGRPSKAEKWGGREAWNTRISSVLATTRLSPGWR
jgi:class 3 adenylate cyclase/tetratricopeptide (TPR) repeat protein